MVLPRPTEHRRGSVIHAVPAYSQACSGLWVKRYLGVNTLHSAIKATVFDAELYFTGHVAFHDTTKYAWTYVWRMMLCGLHYNPNIFRMPVHSTETGQVHCSME